MFRIFIMKILTLKFNVAFFTLDINFFKYIKEFFFKITI